jgi:alpha-galactosidase
MTRITLIGAGSVEFTRILLADLVAFPDLANATIVLHDIDPERLRTAQQIAEGVNRVAGSKLIIEPQLDRRAALDGAQFVVNEIQVGGFEATLRDFEIPAKYGVRQTIGDTLGVGGIFRALRTIPVLNAIANDIADICPEATLLNYTNPMAMLVWAALDGSRHHRLVGLCHSVQNTHEQLAEMVDVPVEEIDYLTAGVNHQAFVLRFEREGMSLYPRLDDAIARDPHGLARRVRIALYRELGYFPTESSEHSAEYVPWIMRHDDQVEKFRVPVGEYLTRSERNMEEYETTRKALEAADELDLTPTSELASEIIHAHQTGDRAEVYVNVPNEGRISNLPDECCVEVPALVDADGIHPQQVGALPPQLAALNRTFLNVVELTVKAVLEGERQHVYQAALLDPNTAATLTTSQTIEMCDELFEAHGDLMPEALRS